MFRANLIGNLGADAEVINYNGSQFLTFNVADTIRLSDGQGGYKDRTQWISCSWNGFPTDIVKHMTKGRQVYVQGRAESEVYSSPKYHRMMSKINLYVERLELLSKPDLTIKELVNPDGLLLPVRKELSIEIPEGVTKKSILEGQLQTITGTPVQVIKKEILTFSLIAQSHDPND